MAQPKMGVAVAQSLAKTIYDNSLGGSGPLLDRTKLILNDMEDMTEAEQMLNGRTRQASIQVFDDPLAQVIDVVMMLVVGCSLIVAPLTFLWDGRLSDPSTLPGNRGLVIADLILDLLFAAYLLLKLDMSYMHAARRIEVVTSEKIRMHYLRSPLYWAHWLGVTVYFWVLAANAPLLINLVKIVRGSAFIKLPDSLWRLRDTSWVRVATPVTLLMGASHWVACLLFCLGGPLDKANEEGWSYFETVFRNETVSGQVSGYIVSYVEAIYMLTGSLDGPTGAGAREGNFGALVMVVVFAPIGQLVVAFFIASIVEELSLQNALDFKHHQNKAFIKRALQIVGVPRELQRRVFSQHYFQKMGQDFEALQILFERNHLSNSLKSAILIFLYKDSVLSSPYFSGKDPNYIIEVIRCFEDQVFLPGDYVARRGEVARHMYFIARGELAVLVPDIRCATDVEKAKNTRHLGRGAYFGEVALIKDCVRTAWIRAETYALLSSLSRLDIEPIWRYFPEEREHLVQSVTEIAARDRRCQAMQRWMALAEYANTGHLRNQEEPEKSTELPVATASLRSRQPTEKRSRLSTLDQSLEVHHPDDIAAAASGQAVRMILSGDSAALGAADDDDEQTAHGQLAADVRHIIERQTALESMVAAIASHLGVPSVGTGHPPDDIIATSTTASASPSLDGHGGWANAAASATSRKATEDQQIGASEPSSSVPAPSTSIVPSPPSSVAGKRRIKKERAVRQGAAAQPSLSGAVGGESLGPGLKEQAVEAAQPVRVSTQEEPLAKEGGQVQQPISPLSTE